MNTENSSGNSSENSQANPLSLEERLVNAEKMIVSMGLALLTAETQLYVVNARLARLEGETENETTVEHQG